ncbi:hypothetical protein DFQ27_002182 [Actinomortierella ambigua]|uniref:EI24 domain-containing protein n=1 Tax=Actinomortierella ambigua TaxID=1343610 RepID=A0A9P6QIG9_9FUNG|nr:hypothetical protein DFQ26_004834 [Actinomortierella ambigua]KAG0269766.1 hypothetical protein DFQ27_002182 [Actinomortierella ambigua]
MAHRQRILYPFKGIVYFFTHPRLWPRVILPFLVILVLSIFLFVLAFRYLLPWQRDAFLDRDWATWIATTVAVILTLLEAALGSLIAYLALMPLWEDALFDAVLRSRKLGYVVDAVHGDMRTCLQGVMGGLYIVLFQSVVLLSFQVISLIILLPLHVVPFLGTAVYCYLNGWVLTFSKRIHYDVELRKMSVSQSRRYAWKHRTAYCEFGAVAVFLEMTPILNLFFFWTNVVGAALWVADEIEEAQRQARLASLAHQQQGSQYVTFYPYESYSPGQPTEPLLGAPPSYASATYGSTR